jgi:hypothetical protein
MPLKLSSHLDLTDVGADGSFPSSSKFMKELGCVCLKLSSHLDLTDVGPRCY